MKHKLIQTDNYLLIVDDSEIKIGDLYLNQTGNVIEKLTYRIPSSGHWCKKITAHLPLNGAPVLEGVDLLPPIEDEVDILLKIEQEEAYKNGKGSISWYEEDKRREYYNKAKEKYKYTEEDLRKAFRSGAFTGAYTGNNSGVHIEKDENIFIQSLQQSKMPVAFECEVERIYPNPQTISKEYDFDDILIERKTTTNSQGQTVWVGKYIFND